MARIVATLDYEPYLTDDSYPDSVTTKAEAMAFDVAQLLAGNLSDVELLDFADDIIWEVVE